MIRTDLENLIIGESGDVCWTRGNEWTAADVIHECELELSEDERLASKSVWMHDYDGEYYEECRESDEGALSAMRWEIVEV